MLNVAAVLALNLLTQTVSAGGADCSGNWLDCENGKCVSEVWLCDGDNDCGNFKDEQNCDVVHRPSHTCMSSQFRCTSDNICIPNTWLCDGEKDCEDGTDELRCGNRTEECNGFLCKDHHCIPARWRCDGHKDCRDGSDEDLCSTEKLCSEFQCSSGSCVKQSLVCDGKRDCSDGSDEGPHCGDSCSNTTCSQKCINTPSGPECVCDDGYYLDAKDNTTCLDVDECLEEGFCSQTCSNQDGGFECSCLDGYELVNRTCLAKGGDPLILFSTTDEIRGLKLRSGTYFPIRKAIVRASAVDADPISQRIYWVEVSKNKSAVYSAKMDGSDLRTVLAQGLLLPEDIAVDCVARNLYITDSGLKQVLACRMDGTMCSVLHSQNVVKPRSIVVDSVEGLLYWSDWSDAAAGIYKSGTDGSRRVTFVSRDISWPNGIAIDHTTGRLYWADAKRNTIEYITLDGNTRKILLDGTVFHPYSLTVFEDHLYWTDWTTFSLESSNKFTGHKTTVIVRENGKHIMGVHAYHPVLAPRASNPCWSNTCSHMCLISPSGRYRCSCPPGFSLTTDDRTCKIDHEYPSIFISEGASVYHTRPDSVGRGAITELPLPLRSALISRVVYDHRTRVLFASDLAAPAIHAVNMTSLHTWFLVKNHTVSPEDLAFDSYSNNLYWVDSSKATMEVVSVSLKRRATLVDGLIGPVAIAISRSGHVFVATVGLHSISMYDMDGKNPKQLSSVGGFPLSVAVHPTKTLLYWADPISMVISSLNYSSLRPPRAVTNRVEGLLSVAVSEDSIYCTVGKRELHVMKGNRTRVLQLPGYDKGIVTRKVTYSSGVSPSGVSPCSIANGGCSYLCLSSLLGRVCACSTGMVLAADNLTCIDGDCSGDDFRCAGSGRCFPAEFRCDGSRDCDDGSDEIGCDNFCSGDDFKCRNGRCIIKSWKCDRRDDCGDNSDEDNCPEVAACAEGQFSCNNGECIPTLWRCDGQPDCLDNSDETNCEVTRCDLETQMRCGNGQCIPISWVCDGSSDCFGGLDEANCTSDQQRTCSAHEFRCGGDGSCIDMAMRCDRRADCDDGSDEKGCSDSSEGCKAGFYRCNDGACIYHYERCDGHNDCSASEDEANCTYTSCRDGDVLCPDKKRCIVRRWVCDGDEDCADGSDEEDCDKQRTEAPVKNFSWLAAQDECDEFFCYTNGRCLPWNRVCDGVQDCSDLPDEGGACSAACESPERGACAQICQKTPRGPKCFCYKGYRLLPDNRTCDDVDECKELGSCSQYCNNTKGGFKCSCTEGYILHHDHRRCRADGGPANLLYLLGDQIRGINLFTQATQVYLKMDSADMLGMDYDAAENVHYWTGELDGSINSYSADTHRFETVVKSSLKPVIVKYDWIAKNLYYTDKDANLGVCSKDGKYCSSLLKSVSTAINAMDISPTTGQMFWTTFSSPLRKLYTGLIERADMDGSRRVTIVSHKTNWPSALVVDHVLKMIYWSDSELNTLECADFQGYNRRIIDIKDPDRHVRMYHPYAIAVFEDFLYWADWASDSINRCNKFTGEDFSNLRESNVKAEALLIAHKVLQPKGVNYCARNGCPHLCLLNPSGSSCMCADDYGSGNGTCSPSPDSSSSTIACPAEHCLNEGECVAVNGSVFTCACKEPYSGSMCENKAEAVGQTFDYSSIVAVLFAFSVAGLILLGILLCKRNREKLHKVTESVAVKFRKQMSGREGHRLVVDTDACDELDLGPDYKQPFSNYTVADQRWQSCANFFGRLKGRDSPLCK